MMALPSDAGCVDIPIRSTVLVIVSDRDSRELIVSVLKRNGYDVLAAANGDEGVMRARSVLPNLVIAERMMSGDATPSPVEQLRRDPLCGKLPFLFLSEHDGSDGSTSDVLRPLDASIVKPVRPPELVARVRAMMAQSKLLEATHDRRSVSRQTLLNEPVSATGRSVKPRLPLLSEHAFLQECAFDVARARRDGERLCFAHIALFEFPGIRDAFGQRGEAIIARDVALVAERFPNVLRLGIDGEGRFLVLLGVGSGAAHVLLNCLSRAIVAHRFAFAVEPIRLTPIVGYASHNSLSTIDETCRRARLARSEAETHLDLQAVAYSGRLESVGTVGESSSKPERRKALLAPLIVPLQLASTLGGCLVVPFAAYWFLGAHGLDISNIVYIFCVITLCLTAFGILWESVLALEDIDPPSAAVYPSASAIIAAYLPNEAGTVIETIESFLRVNYASDLQIILAYNTPRSLATEEELQRIAERDPRFVPLRVHGSTSKAQNVNAALRIVSGAFVGVFDADHKPDPDSFTRAWNWLANGYDIVQGHCLIRNGDESISAQLVAVEFESIYAVSHPGRARLHGFGIFGGSNGYWKTDLLRQTRMHHFMLTEDIDSSLRVTEAGFRIASDRKLISRELAPITFRALWHQRLRWAQGWFQVSLKHLVPALRSPHLSMRQKIGMMHLLFWRECYVWICIQILPIIGYWLFIRHDRLSWCVPIFLVTTVVTAMTGPVQLVFTYLLAHPDIRARRTWFVVNFFASLLFFSELKNVIARLAHLKEFMRERTWKVTPRTSTLTNL